MSPARQTAFEVLHLVERGGYASDLLLSRTRRLDSRDAGLASEIVFGCLRFRAQLDFLIEHFSGRAAAGLDPETRESLRMGIYQLRYLDRIPGHAVVSEAVELVKQAGRRPASGLVNAVLRRVTREPVEWPDRATELSHPPWLLERWSGQYGQQTADRIAGTFLRQPETYVRIPSGVVPKGLEAEPTEIPGCFRVLGGERGGLRVQDIGSQAVAFLLDLGPGHSFLDLCAAPGNKTAQALEAGVRAVACDRRMSRLKALKSLGCPLVVLDGEAPLPFGARFDRILLDAPCSGTGTLGRNPEIKWRLKPEDLARHQTRQVRLLTRALEVLAPGGKLVYSTCSLEREENQAVLQAALGHVPPSSTARIPGTHPGDGFFAAVIGST
ncbi:MAG TPA: transcription antitermination factor NusB [Bryobacteraceae bacterium]|nr:transcription antitermination factor NusB [Bryobacteraceae bacterium]